MATLEKIRSKGVLLLIIVGFALLAFIVGDFVNSGATYFNQKHMKVAEINGEDVKIETFLAAVDQLTNVYKIEMNQELTEEMTEQVRQSVWETLVRERVLLPEAEAIGLTVTKQELFDKVLGNNVHPMIQARRVFANPETGAFDKNTLAQFISMIDDPEANIPAETKSYWTFWESAVKKSSLEEKYNTLISKAITTNTLEAEHAYELNKKSVDILYALEPYYMVSDSIVSVSDGEVKARYEKEIEKYKKQTATCMINYVTVDVKPSEEDFAELEEWINALVPEFKTTAEVAEMVNANSDSRYLNAALAKEDIDVELRDFAFSGKKDDVFGPFFSNNEYKLARIVETGILTPDSLKLRHIYVSEATKVRTTALADSILAEIKKGADFAVLAKTFSKVTQTAQNGGEIGWVREPEMDAEIAVKAFSTPLNGVFTIDVNNSVQIFQVMEVSEKVAKVKLAVIERELIPSSRTQAKLYNEAKQFAAASKSFDAFEKNAKEKGLALIPAKGVDINANRLNDIKNSRQIIRWAFDQKNGTTSDVFECDQKFVIASVSNINKEDYEFLSDVSEQIKSELSKEKKGDFILQRIAGKTLTDLMAEGMRVDTLKDVTFEAQQMPKVGMEPVLFAKACSGKDAAVKGNSGVFMYHVYAVNEIPTQFNVAEEKAVLNSRNAYVIPYISIEVLKERAEIKDNRSIVY